MCLIYIIIYCCHSLPGIGIGIKHNLRNIPSVFLVFVQNTHQFQSLFCICVSVSGVKYQKIHIGVGQHLDMLAHNPFVIGSVISEKRFTPEMMATDSSAAGFNPSRLGTQSAFNIFKLTVIVRTRRSVLSLPEKIEYSDVSLAFTAIWNGVIHRENSPQIIYTCQSSVYFRIVCACRYGIFFAYQIIDSRIYRKSIFVYFVLFIYCFSVFNRILRLSECCYTFISIDSQISRNFCYRRFYIPIIGVPQL